MRQIIFVVEDESEIRQIAQLCLEQAGFEVHSFYSTADVIKHAENIRPSLILVSLMATDGNGLNLCRNLRNSAVIAGTPLIFLIEASGAGARVLALESGGDDCIVKPFSPAELVARVQAILRRLEQGPALPIPIDRADLVIDSSAMRLSVRGIEVATTSLEFCLIEYLARHRGKVFTRDLLLDAVWGDMQFVTPRSVDACVRRIREKIEPDRTRPTYLKTVRGVGYRLDAVTAWPVNSTGPCSCIACRTPAASSRLLQTRSTRRRRISA